MPVTQRTSNWILKLPGRAITLLPGDCLICGRVCHRRYNLCLRCENALPWIDTACDRCGQAMRCQQGTWRCLPCQNKALLVTRCVSALHYCDPVDWILTGFKFQGQLGNGRLLASLLARRIQACHATDELPQLLLPVPLHSTRWHQRGFNQSVEIARELARCCHIPLGLRVLQRHKPTTPQSEQDSIAARRNNVRDAFIVATPSRLRGVSHVAIVDDVITTMATVNAVTACLLKQGVARVDAWSVARVHR